MYPNLYPKFAQFLFSSINVDITMFIEGKPLHYAAGEHPSKGLQVSQLFPRGHHEWQGHLFLGKNNDIIKNK